MKRFLSNILLSAALALSLFVVGVPAEAQQINQTVAVCDPLNPTVCVTNGAGGLTTQVIGDSANSAADSGSNPVKIGCVYSTTGNLQAFVAGNRANVQCDSVGNARTLMTGVQSTPVDTAVNVIQPVNRLNAVNAAPLGTLGYVWNGTNAIIQRGDVNGLFVQGNVASGATDAGSPVKVGCPFNTTPPTVTTGQRVDCQSDANGNQRISLSGPEAAATDGQTNVLTYAGSPMGVAARRLLATGNFVYDPTAATWQRTRGTVEGTFVNTAGTTDANAALSNATTAAVANNIVAKGSAGNFYGANFVAGASAGFFLMFDATTAPADGAVTPKRCYPVAANQSIGVNNDAGPIRFATGIVAVFSTTGCFTKTASATAFMSVDYK